MTRDPEPERQRLAQLYARMTPEELERVADDAASLTELAHEILNTEMARRGLARASDELPAARNVMEERDLVAIRRYRDLPEALLAKGSSRVSTSSASSKDYQLMDWFISNLLGGVKLVVNREDAEAATVILDEPAPETLDVVGESCLDHRG